MEYLTYHHRPSYQVEYTDSCPIIEVKQNRAWPVPGWVTLTSLKGSVALVSRISNNKEKFIKYEIEVLVTVDLFRFAD